MCETGRIDRLSSFSMFSLQQTLFITIFSLKITHFQTINVTDLNLFEYT